MLTEVFALWGPFSSFTCIKLYLIESSAAYWISKIAKKSQIGLYTGPAEFDSVTRFFTFVVLSILTHLDPFFTCWSIFAYGLDFAEKFANAKNSAVTLTPLSPTPRQISLCNAPCDVKFSQIEGNDQKFNHIKPNISVIL